MTAPALPGLAPPAARAFDQALHRIDVPRGHRVFAEGQSGDGLAVVEHGRVGLSRRGPDGRDRLVAVKGPADIIGELSVLDPGPRQNTAVALTDARLGWLRREAFSEWLAANPDAVECVVRLLTRRLRRTRSQAQALVSTDVAGRVAVLLLELTEQFGVPQDGLCLVSHGLTQDELAQLVGASRETVNKVLADFSARGWIVRSARAVTILDAGRLRGRVS